MFQIRLTRPDSSYPWGFRLEGGSDLPSPLKIQKVKANSLAERAGLHPDDVVLRINQSDARYLRHDQAKMEIIRSCNEIFMTVERASGKDHAIHIVTHNNPVQLSSSPLSSFDSNSPVGLQTGPGAHHNQPLVRQTNSMSYNSPPSVNRSTTNHLNYSSPPSWAIGTSHNAIPAPYLHHSADNQSSGFRSVQSPKLGRWAPPTPSHDVGHFCGACGEDINGAFVKVQNRVPMHPHCMVCCYCGVSLQHVGYFCIKDRLYCDIHATHA